jgi:hypothetical protein
MSASSPVVPLLVFEAADCLMAVIACEVVLRGSDPLLTENVNREALDLCEYFDAPASDGPWLQWARGRHAAWLRVRQVIDVMPMALAGLTPMPAVLRSQTRTRAFLAAGVRGNDLFLLLDPARLARPLCGA